MKNFRFHAFTVLFITIFMNQLAYGAQDENIKENHKKLGIQIESQIELIESQRKVIENMKITLHDVYNNLYLFQNTTTIKEISDYNKMIDESLQKISPHINIMDNQFTSFKSFREYEKKVHYGNKSK
jgi:hypothetical protein